MSLIHLTLEGKIGLSVKFFSFFNRKVHIVVRSVTSRFSGAYISYVVSSGLFPLEGSRTEVGGKC